MRRVVGMHSCSKIVFLGRTGEWIGLALNTDTVWMLRAPFVANLNISSTAFNVGELFTSS